MSDTKTTTCRVVDGWCRTHCYGPACYAKLFYACCGACQGGTR